MITASVVEFRPGTWDNVKEALSRFSEIEIYGVNISLGRALVLFDTNEQKGVEELCKKLNTNDDMITISHHSFYFEEDGAPPPPPIDELFKRR